MPFWEVVLPDWMPHDRHAHGSAIARHGKVYHLASLIFTFALCAKQRNIVFYYHTVRKLLLGSCIELVEVLGLSTEGIPGTYQQRT